MAYARDPRLGAASWRAIVAEWNRRQPTDCQAPRCLLPGIPIRYGTPRGPASLDVGHITPLIHDTRQTWHIDDTRPEHQRCNRSAGTAIGKARARHNTTPPPPPGEQAATAHRW